MKIAKFGIIFFIAYFLVIIALNLQIKIVDASSNKTKQEAIDWANYQADNNSYLDRDGAYGNQCVDLIMYYYEHLGVNYVSGNGCDYITNPLPEGWKRIQNTLDFIPEPGDVAVWGKSAGGGYGHVAIILSANSNNFTSVDQNWPIGSNCKRVIHTYGSGFWGVIRPDYKVSDTTPPIITEAKVERPSDGGGQTARIRVKANDNESGVAGVLCRIFKPDAGEQDFTDNEASLVGDEWIYDFSSADYGGMQGKYRLHIYAYNNVPESGNYSDIKAYELWVESTPPSISGFQIVDIDQNGFAIMGNCSDDTSGIDRVEIYAWEEGKKENETIRSVYPNEQNQINAWISYSDFSSVGKSYNVHVYIFDRAGNYQVTTMLGSQEYQPVKTVSQNGHRYALYNKSGSFELAQRMAEIMGGHLVTINNESEQQLVESLTKDGGQYFYWLGGYTEDHQNWKWQTGEPVNFTNWGQGEPNNAADAEDKMAIYTHSGTWNDMGAGQRTDNGFIVEYEPLNLNTAAKSVSYGGKKYTRYDVGVPYTEAEQYCTDLGGKLATIPNQETNDIIKQLMSDGKSQYWLGGNNIEKNGHWAWNKSDIMQYSNWAQYEPNNGNGGIAEHYLSTYSDGTWNDMPSFTYTLNTQMGFICETNIPVVTPIKLGDVDGDGAINASDGLIALRHSVKEITLKDETFIRADVTKDKIVNAADALQILRYSVKEIMQF